MTSNDSAPEMPQPCDKWHDLIAAAETAGCEAACRLARRSSAAHLALAGRADVHVEPLESPVAEWLHHTGRATINAARTGVLVPVALTAADLHPTADAAQKCRSLLVAHAYAVAYGEVLGDEAGVATEVRVAADVERDHRSARTIRAAGADEPHEGATGHQRRCTSSAQPNRSCTR